ncbi:MAG: tannase/feruloyl esterase family alpha/beta hydrolase [Amphiplicatus sp.]
MQSAAPAGAIIAAADKVEEPVPHCKVEGYILTEDTGPERINFRVQLPDRSLWKKRFYFIGIGGAGGYVPTDSQTPRGNPMRQGFAVAGTDSGIDRTRDNGYEFLADPVKAVNFAYRGAQLATQAAQAITRAYYGGEKFYRYHAGCSGGGRMTGEAAMRFPSDYDGILYGTSRVVPPNRIDAGPYLRSAWVVQQLAREPGAWVSPQKLRMAEKHITAACDAADGAMDDLIWDSRKCKFDVAKLRCKAGDGPDCLTPAEIETIKTLTKAPRDARGKVIFDPLPISNISLWADRLGDKGPPTKLEPGARGRPINETVALHVSTRTRIIVGPDWEDMDFQSKKDLDRWVAGARRTQWGYATDLTPMFRTGGKIISWGGSSDPMTGSPWGHEDYAQYLADHYFWNGMEDVHSFLQTYTIPGMGHCYGGTGPADGPDRLMQALIDWVEQGKTPGPVVMHSAQRAQPIFAAPAKTVDVGVPVDAPTGPSRDFLVCPYPQRSVFKGGVDNPRKLDVFSADNWSCQSPEE